MTIVDRRYSVAEGTAVKAPCRAATTANIALTGLQTIDGVALVEADRVLVKDQSTASENGIYSASTGNWTRTRDFDGAYDIVHGTQVFITDGSTYARYVFYVSTANPITIDSTSIAFTRAILSDAVGITGTSTTSLLIGAGSKVFTTQVDLGWVVGSRIRAAYASDTTKYMEGLATAYSSTSLTVLVDTIGGSGTFASWNLSLSGDPGISTDIRKTYATKADAVADSPAVTVTSIFITDTRSNWSYTSSVPSHAAYFTTANSRKYKLIEFFAEPEMMGAAGDGTTNDTTAFQKISDYAAITGGVLVGRRTSTYKLTAITVANAGTEWLLGPRVGSGAILSWPVLGANVKGVTVTANNFRVTGGKAIGPASGAYVGNENFIHMVGASTSSRLSGLVVEDIEITQFGAHGIYAQFVDDIAIARCHIHHCGYAGYGLLSCDHNQISENHLHHMTPGDSGNMYGGFLAHDNTNYNVDPNAGTRNAANPFCFDCTVESNRVHDINWEGLDCHGAYAVRIINNKVHATPYGITCPSSSNAGANYAGWDNIIRGNIVDSRNEDNSVSGYENTAIGINLNGGSTVNQQRIICTNNIVRFKGVSNSANQAAIAATLCTDIVVSNNIIENWNGSCVYANDTGGIISGNQFGTVNAGGDLTSACILDDSAGTTKKLIVANNNHDGAAGAVYGFRQTATPTFRPTLSGNNFALCTTPFSLATAGFCLGSDLMPTLVFSSAAGTIPLAELEGQDALVLLVSGSTYNITNFSGYQNGQRLTVVNQGSGTATITRAQAKLSGSTNKGLGLDNVIQLQFIGSTAYQIATLQADG